MHVYTLRDMRTTEEISGVLLLHGSGDCDEAGRRLGRAGFILDNLIAAGKAKPVIVAMPAGTPARPRLGAGSGAAAQRRPRARDEFYEDFTTDAMPYIEQHYGVLAGRGNRAIAGLSMAAARPWMSLSGTWASCVCGRIQLWSHGHERRNGLGEEPRGRSG